MAKLTFPTKTNKIPVVDNTKQISAEDLNEIKSIVNENDDTALAFAKSQAKLINKEYNLKGICIADQEAPAGVLNDIYYYVGDVTATVFGIVDIPRNSFIWHSGTAWEYMGQIEDLSQKVNKIDLLTNSQKNLFNKDTVVPGFRVLAESGNITPIADYWASDFIPVLPETQYCVNKTFVFGCFYNSEKVRISGMPQAANQKIITTPVNAAFIRISESINDATYENYQLELGTVSTDFEPFMIDKYVDKLELATLNSEIKNQTYNIYTSKNLFNKGTVVTGFYIDTVTGVLNVSADYWVSDFIHTLPDKQYCVNKTFTFICFYDDQKARIGGQALAGQKVMETPANCAYIRISENINAATYENYQLELGTVSTAYEPYGMIEINKADESLMAVKGYLNGSFIDGSKTETVENMVLSGVRWLTFNNENTVFEGVINKIYIDVLNSGNVTIGIGLIDQRGWAIVDSEFVINCPVVGLNTIDVNVILPKGKRLFIKTPITVKKSNSGFCLLSNDGGIILSEIAGKINFYYELTGKKYGIKKAVNNEDILTISESVAEATERLNSFTLEKSFLRSTNKIWQLSISDTGVLTTTEASVQKIAVFGNSIDYHGLASYWWGVWGMAATRRENDWRHQLESMLLAKGYPVTSQAFNIAEWERNAATFDYSTMNPILGLDTDLVIFRIGENNENSATLTADTITLINHVKTIAPQAEIVFGGTIWTNTSRQPKLKAAADSFGNIPFVDFSDLNTAENMSALGTKVYGDDGQWHTIDHSGVAAHPGDKGQKAMAVKLLPYVIEKLSI